MSSDLKQSPQYRKIEVRKGQVTEKMPRDAFRERFMARFYDPAFRSEDESVARLEAIAWNAYSNGRKAPITEKAGTGFKDPDYELSVEWRAASDRIKAAQARQQDREAPSRVLVVNAKAVSRRRCRFVTGRVAAIPIIRWVW
jgi:hypothetical protein